MMQLAREVGVARNTAQARLDRLLDGGVITGFGPEIDLRRLGYGVSAFVTIEIAQGRGPDVDGGLAAIPEVVEAYMTTGSADLLCRVVARDNADLQRVIDAVVEVPGVIRTSTVIALATAVSYRTMPLVRATGAAN